MTIANRILLGFAAIGVLVIAMGLYDIGQVGTVRDVTEQIVSRDLAMQREISTLRLYQARQRALTDNAEKVFYVAHALAKPIASTQDYPSQFRQQVVTTQSAIARAAATAERNRTTALNDARQQTWNKIGMALTSATADLELMRQQSEAVFAAANASANDPLQVEAAEDKLNGSRTEFANQLTAIEAALNDGITLGQQNANQTYTDSRASIIVGLGVVMVLGILITWLIRRSIVVPLAAFSAFVERVGRGELSGEAAAGGNDELGRLGATLNRMVDGLRQLAKQTRDAAENLNAATAEIRASTQEQAAGVEEQLAAVQETAATVDEITHAGAQIGKRAQEVIASAQATAQTSAEGLKAVDDTARSIDAIREQAEAVASNIISLSEKTQAIGEITATVNDISERSHLLALNAAIEAAAAGDAGRSFAVVASELKLLADQAKEATTQVRAILGDVQRGINASVMLTEEAVKRVTAGKERTDTTHHTIREMAARVQESVQTFQQIVASTNQQQLGIEQVMGALQNIRQASQQTVSGTRQLDQAAGNLTGLSSQLLVLVERYRL